MSALPPADDARTPDSTLRRRVGFVGLGRMGAPMASALLRAGFPPTVANRTQRPILTEFRDQEATVAGSPGEVAERVDVVVTMASDGAAARDVLLNPGGVRGAARPGRVVLEMGTIEPAAARELCSEVARSEVKMPDAPVSGRVASKPLLAPTDQLLGVCRTVAGDDADVVRVADAAPSVGSRAGAQPLPTGAAA